MWCMQADFNAPVRTTKYPREVPPLPWYRKAPVQMLMAGFLPFSAIYIELYYIFASVWGHKVIMAGLQSLSFDVAHGKLGYAGCPAESVMHPSAQMQLAREDKKQQYQQLEVFCVGFQVRSLCAGLHDLQHPVHRVSHPNYCDGLHHGGPHLLSAGRGGPQVVVAVIPERRQYRWVPLLLHCFPCQTQRLNTPRCLLKSQMVVHALWAVCSSLVGL